MFARPQVLWIALAFALGLLPHFWWDAKRRHCPICSRLWAVWPIRGLLRRWIFVCRTCHKSHHRRALAR